MLTLPSSNLLVSFIISTHNRREVLLDSLPHVLNCGLSSQAFEVLIVDNASTDGTRAALAEKFSQVKLLRMSKNFGSCAKNFALAVARGRYFVFLDDDSYPMPGSTRRMIKYFEAHPSLGAASFTVTLPDGSRECSAYPDVFIGCGVGFRRSAIADAGPLPGDFFMQAEEYDLSLRLLDTGWQVKSFADLHVAHRKTPHARRSKRTTRLDVRNNLTLAARYFPKQWNREFALDWAKRYYCIARKNNHRLAFFRGLLEGVTRSIRPAARRVVNPAAFEQFTRLNQIELTLRAAKDQLRLKRVLFADFGKNILPYYLAAENCGLEIAAVADNKLAGSTYRGVPVVNDATAMLENYDAVVISNSSPVHASRRKAEWMQLDPGTPVLDLLETATVEQSRAMRYVA